MRNAPESEIRAGTDARTKIEFAAEGLRKEEAYNHRGHQRTQEIENELITRLANLRLGADDYSTQIEAIGKLRTENQILQQHLDNAPALRQAVTNLLKELEAAKPVIQGLAERRNPAESTIFECFWFQRLVVARDVLMPLETRIQNTLDITQTVLADLRQVLSARVPICLSQDERQQGILMDGHCIVRPLTMEERVSGLVHE